MFATRRPKIHRRSLLMTIVGSLAALTLPRSSYGAEIGANHQSSRGAPSRLHASNSFLRNEILRTIDLKTVGPEQQVASIQYSDGKYHVVTGSRTTVSFPEFNLHFKIDSTAHGPISDRPVLLPAGTQGDRASVVFSGPAEIARLIEEKR